MKNRKKTVIAALILLLVMSIAAACAGKKDPSLKVNDETFTLTDGGEYVAAVAADVSEMDVLSKFSVDDGYIMKLYSDEELTDEVRGAAQLYVGENVFWLRVVSEKDNNAKVYVIRITRAKQYKVTFKDGSTVLAEVFVEEGQKLDANDIPTPIMAGYTFDGWDKSVDEAINEATTYKAKWKANTDTAYKVEHYKQTVYGTTDYTLAETENLVGTTDTTATATQKTYPGFAFYALSSTTSGIIAGDGTLVLKMYYNIVTVGYTVNVYEENVQDNNYTLVTNKCKSLTGNLTATVNFTPESATGFSVDNANSILSITLGENADNNVIAVYYKRIRATVTFKMSGGNQSRTAKYGYGLTESAPAFVGTPGTGYENYWAIDGTEKEVNFAKLTADVTVEQKKKIETETVFFDFKYDADIDEDGIEYSFEEDLKDGSYDYSYDDDVTFSVKVRGDFNRSIQNVKYYFKKTSETAGTEISSTESTVDDNTHLYTYTFKANGDGTVYKTGEYVENTYAVTLTVDLFDSDWGTLETLSGVKYVVDDGNEYAVGDGNLRFNLKKGAHVIKVIEPNGKTTNILVEIQSKAWQEMLDYNGEATDIGRYTAGYSRISSAGDVLKQNNDGTVDARPDSTDLFSLSDYETNGTFAVKTRFTVTKCDNDPGYGYQIYYGENRLLTVYLMKKIIRVVGTGSDPFGTRTEIVYSATELETPTDENPLVLDLMLLKTNSAILLYYGVDGDGLSFLAMLDAEKITTFDGATKNYTDDTAAGVNEALGREAVTVKICASIQGERSVTYSHYGVRKVGFVNSFSVPDSVDGGSIMINKATAEPGETVKVTATPTSGKRVKSFTVSKNGGDAIGLSAAITTGKLKGDVESGYEFEFALTNYGDSYAFNVVYENIPAKASYTGKVVDLDNTDTALDGVKVSATDENGNLVSVMTDAQGDYTLVLTSGTYTFTYEKENYFTRAIANVVLNVENNGALINADSLELKYMVVGGSTVLNGTKIESYPRGASEDRQTVEYDYENETLNVYGGGPKGLPNGRGLLITGVKSTYSMVRFKLHNNGNSTEQEPGVGVYFAGSDGTPLFEPLFVGDKVRCVVPSYVADKGVYFAGSNIGSVGVYELMVVRADTVYYMFARRDGEPNWQCLYSGTIAEFANGTYSNIDGEAAIGFAFSKGTAKSLFLTFTDIEVSEQQEEIEKIINTPVTVTINKAQNGSAALSGSDVTQKSDDSNKTVYSVVLGSDAMLSITPSIDDYEVSNVLVNGVKTPYADGISFNKLGCDLTVSYEITAPVPVEITGKLTSSISTFGNVSNKIVFVRNDGTKFVGNVTSGADGIISYTANLLKGTYLRATYANFTCGGFEVTAESTTVDITFTLGNNYDQDAEHSGVAQAQAIINADGSFEANTDAKNNPVSTYVLLRDITFIPNKQTLEIGYTLTGMNNALDNPRTTVGYGIIDSDGKGAGWSLWNVSTGVCPSAVTEPRPGGSIRPDTDARTALQNALPGYQWNEANKDTKIDIKWVIKGYKTEMYVRINGTSEWKTVFAGDNARDIQQTYNSGVTIAGVPSDYLVDLYDPSKVCTFGISMYRAVSQNDTNSCQVSGVWYNLSDNAANN